MHHDDLYDIIDQIEKSGGTIVGDDEGEDGRFFLWISFTNKPLTDDELRQVVPYLKSAHVSFLSLLGTNITDDGLVHLQGLEDLTDLGLSGMSITDHGLANLRDIESIRLQMEDLGLNATKITDAGIDYLVDFHRLESLSLSCTEITDASLVPISKMSKLTRLDLCGTKVTETGVNALRSARPELDVQTSFSNW